MALESPVTVRTSKVVAISDDSETGVLAKVHMMSGCSVDSQGTGRAFLELGYS